MGRAEEIQELHKLAELLKWLTLPILDSAIVISCDSVTPLPLRLSVSL